MPPPTPDNLLPPEIPGYYRHKREDLADLVPRGPNRVLDIGCGCGLLGAHLKETGRATYVLGVEFNEAAAREAKRFLDEVHAGDFERMELPCTENSLDVVVMADVLEHLADPWVVLGRVHSLLKPGGHLLLSIPNIQFYRVIKGLLKGEFTYTDAGILDRTHLRFFTRKSAAALLMECDFTPVRWERVLSRRKTPRRLNRLFLNRLRDFITEQYYILSAASK
jgi:2-polyprenyl-3-methyl-5-hydroxy-6-metoxy-1,4-benzoquinol methylase